jgi:uncharacterized protein
MEQLKEVIKRFQLNDLISPFNRCLKCNTLLKKVNKMEVNGILEENTINYFNEFYICNACRRVYWKGSHYHNMANFIKLISEL